MTSTLVLGWGNPGRLDDGLGPACARRLARALPPSTEVEALYQLQVEDAAEAARHDRVVFVDADRTGPAPFWCERVTADDSGRGVGWSTHSVSPSALLALARDLFGAEPEAWLVGIRGYAFDDFGERLSEKAEANLEATAGFLERALVVEEFAGHPRRQTVGSMNPGGA